jgi:hypothetical protein
VTEFGYKPGVLLMRLGISAGFTAAGLALWALAGWGVSGFDAILGMVVAVFFGLRALLNLGEIVFPRPVIRVDESGVHDRRLGPETIPWPAITGIKQVSGKMGGGTLFLEVREPARYVSIANPALWIVYKLRSREADGMLPLTPPLVLRPEAPSLIEAILEHAPHDIPVS